MITEKTILVGTCGFNRSRTVIFKNLDVVEIQQTFYDPPEKDKLEELRKQAPQNFEFTIKAWMLVTHKYNKKLWKRLKRSVPGNLDNYGFFKNTREVEWAWSKTLEAARAVNASIIVLQSPASFMPSDTNKKNVELFFKRHSNDGFLLGWEPRGYWWDDIEYLKKLTKKYNIIIIGDYLRGRVLENENLGVAYTRLHGLGGKEVNYKYKYTDSDLKKLYYILFNLKSKKYYILFNNIYSYTDALRFKKLLLPREPQ